MGNVKLFSKSNLLGGRQAGQGMTEYIIIVALSEIKVIEIRAETLAKASDLCRHHFHGAFLELLVDRLAMANLRLSQLLIDRNISVF